MDKEDVVHIYNGILLSHKKERNRDVDGPRDCHMSEVSQKEKNKYCILTHICGIQKNGTDEPVCKAGIETQMQRTHIWTPGGKAGWWWWWWWDELGDWD